MKTPKAGNTKKIQNRPPWVGPRKKMKKLPKNKKMAIFGPFLHFFGDFFVLLGPSPGWVML